MAKKRCCPHQLSKLYSEVCIPPHSLEILGRLCLFPFPSKWNSNFVDICVNQLSIFCSLHVDKQCRTCFLYLCAVFSCVPSNYDSNAAIGRVLMAIRSFTPTSINNNRNPPISLSVHAFASFTGQLNFLSSCFLH